MARQRSWEQVKRDRPVDAERVAAYRALLEAERALLTLLGRRAGEQPKMEEALADARAAASAGDPGLGLYLETLWRYLQNLDGRLELRAILPEGEVQLPLAPASRAD